MPVMPRLTATIYASHDLPGCKPVRIWLTPEDAEKLERELSTPIARRPFMGLPVSIDQYGGKSRVVSDDGFALKI